MTRILNQEWVGQIAEGLICESIHQMSGIALKGVADAPVTGPPMSAVYGETRGLFRIRMQLRAEWKLFERLAENMQGGAVEGPVETEEYATEFFNIVCGRFVSEIYHVTGQAARFLPAVFEPVGQLTSLEGNGPVKRIHFISDENETAIFSWMVVPTAQV